MTYGISPLIKQKPSFGEPFMVANWARNAVRAYRSAATHIEEPVLCHTVGLAALLSIVIPVVANLQIGRDTLIELARLIR